MLSTTYFVAMFVILTLVGIGIILILNRNATPLRKAYSVYITMSILHGILFLGLILMLPFTLSSLPLERYNTDEIETISDIKEKLKEQREDIEHLRNQVDQIRETIWTFALILLMFAPILYYNLFKYNLEIEKLSGKRRGSFD